MNSYKLFWLTEDGTNNRDKWISLNFRFYWGNSTQKVYQCRIAVIISCQCSLWWMLNVVESLRLSYLFVCGDSTSRKWRWSLCLVQIVGVAIWSGDRFFWRQSLMWMHWLQRLDDWCPGLGSTLVNWVCVDVASSVGASPNSVSLGDERCWCLVAQEQLLG